MDWFDVDQWNTISYGDYHEPTSNADAFGLSVNEVQSVRDVLNLEMCNQWFAQHAETVWIDQLEDFLNFVDCTDVLTPEQHRFYKRLKRGVPEFCELRAWVKYLPDEWSADFVLRCAGWLSQTPCDSSQEGWCASHFPVYSAMNFFEWKDRQFLKELGVVIIEGEHPGSSYYAAELRNDIELANAVLEKNACNYRFRRVE